MPVEVFCLVALALAGVALFKTTSLRKRMDALERQHHHYQQQLRELNQQLAGEKARPGLTDAAAAQPCAEPHDALPPPLPRQQIRQQPASAAIERQPATATVSSHPDGGANAGFDLFNLAKTWFTSGNVPVKVGMLVLLAGVAALLNYASSQNWISLPIWTRLLGVAAAATGALLFAWRQRHAKPGFALTVQGGAIGILLLTVFAAYRLYGYLPYGAAFAGTLGLLALAVWLALRQNSVVLAGFALLGGFLAPIWLSSGGGNHVALFGYYALLNAAIVVIALHKSWHILNLQGFVFTFAIASLWGSLQYTPAHYASAQCFLGLFYGMYLLLPMLNAIRGQTQPPHWMAGTLVFGTPLAAFGLQASLFDGNAVRLALVAAGAAVLYGVLAWRFRRQQASLRALAEAYAILATGFATLAVPLGFSARTTACIFALEGAAVTWLGLRQRQALLPHAGIGLHLLGLLAFASTGLDSMRHGMAVFNPLFMTGILLAAAALATAWCHFRMDGSAPGKTKAGFFYVYGLALALGISWHEISEYAPPARAGALHLALLALAGLLAAGLRRRWLKIPALAWTAATLGIWAPVAHWLLEGNLWFHPGWPAFSLAVLVYALCSRAVLHWLRRSADHARLYEATNTAWWLHATGALTIWLWQWLRSDASSALNLLQGWTFPLLSLPVLALAALAIARPAWLGCAGETTIGSQLLQRASMANLAFLALPGLLLAGSSTPLPWLPVLNPQDLMLAAILVLTVAYRRGPAAANAASHAVKWCLIAGLALLWLSKSALAAVHHWGGVPWSVHAMTHSALAQATLTLLWGALAVAAWIHGSRTANRPLWTASMVIMGLVLLKLFLVDRAHLGNLWGIASFIGYGLLCVVVGYIAPSPPRQTPRTAGNTAQ